MVNTVALVLALCWLALLSFTLTPVIDDFKQYWLAAVNLVRSGDPYATGSGYFYPPLFAYLIQPVAFIGQHTGQWLWFGFNSLLLGGFIFLCIMISQSRLARQYWGIVVLLMVIVPSVRITLQLGQVSILLAVMVVASFALSRRNTPLAGLLLSLISLIRLNPALLGFYYLVRRHFKMVAWCAIMALVLVGLSLLAYGVTPYLSYFDAIQRNVYPYAADHNISLFGFWSRLLSTSRYAVPLMHAPLLAIVLTACTSLGVFSVCAWFSRGAADDTGELLMFSLWLCGMMLLWPTNGFYNLLILLLPFLASLHHLEEYPDRRVRLWLVVATALVCIPPRWTHMHPVLYTTAHTGWGLLFLTPALYGVGMYMGILAWLVRWRQANVTHTMTHHGPVAKSVPGA
jgi:hypothetical protein